MSSSVCPGDCGDRKRVDTADTVAPKDEKTTVTTTSSTDDWKMREHGAFTMLHRLAYKGDAEALDKHLILNQGTKDVDERVRPNRDANGDDQSCWTQDTALLIAIRRGKYWAVKVLLDHRADVFIQGSDGLTAIEVAKREARGFAPPNTSTKILQLVQEAVRSKSSATPDRLCKLADTVASASCTQADRDQALVAMLRALAQMIDRIP